MDVTPRGADDKFGEDAESGRVRAGCSDRASPTWADQDELPPYQIGPRCPPWEVELPGTAAYIDQYKDVDGFPRLELEELR